MGSNTYHCRCSQLLLYVPYSLSELPRRADPALDKAFILLTGSPYRGKESNGPPLTNEVSGEQDESYSRSEFLPRRAEATPTIVRRSDGFEKRWLRRCDRCGLVIGYELRREGEESHAEDQGRILYLLEGSLVSTDDLRKSSRDANPGSNLRATRQDRI